MRIMSSARDMLSLVCNEVLTSVGRNFGAGTDTGADGYARFVDKRLDQAAGDPQIRDAAVDRCGRWDNSNDDTRADMRRNGEEPDESDRAINARDEQQLAENDEAHLREQQAAHDAGEFEVDDATADAERKGELAGDSQRPAREAATAEAAQAVTAACAAQRNLQTTVRVEFVEAPDPDADDDEDGDATCPADEDGGF